MERFLWNHEGDVGLFGATMSRKNNASPAVQHRNGSVIRWAGYSQRHWEQIHRRGRFSTRILVINTHHESTVDLPEEAQAECFAQQKHHWETVE